MNFPVTKPVVTVARIVMSVPIMKAAGKVATSHVEPIAPPSVSAMLAISAADIFPGKKVKAK